ncbi:GNAT family N-acetyltransferase [Streptomyces coffeae]|uniref:GNAT family N-acetyltransferase n=1 Tax=Streptomyces coffeae TaxID=621382 RepID=A0ABS1N7N3_9ACTN|nr:GNAT family N-acetyltransferase [Streptomyces coffeae]MBL1096077.1 GNAT family N-acetyltransferase [Streptomyces coffeae]
MSRNTQDSDIELRFHGREGAADLRQLLIDVPADAYADSELAFDSRKRFAWFVDHWSGLDGFVCVVGYDEGEPVGFAYGAPLVAGREWWQGHLEPAPRGRTFGLSELLVQPRWREGGFARRLHDSLIDGRPEELAVLLVDREHPKVQGLYESWAYEKVGERQPFNDSPTYAVMVRTLQP